MGEETSQESKASKDGSNEDNDVGDSAQATQVIIIVELAVGDQSTDLLGDWSRRV